MREYPIKIGNGTYNYIPIYIDYLQFQRNRHIDDILENDKIEYFDLREFHGLLIERSHYASKPEDSYILELAENIIGRSSEVFILDFDNITILGHDSYSALEALINANVVLLNMPLDVFNKSGERFKESEIPTTEKELLDVRRIIRNNFLSPMGISQDQLVATNIAFRNHDIGNESEQILKVQHLLLITILDRYFEDVEGGCRHLPSGNVYVNKYFNAKTLFSNESDRDLIAYLLANLVRTIADNESELLSTNYNSTVLLSILTEMTALNGSSMCSLGPEFSIEEMKYINTFKGNKDFIEIFDFICLGNEYRLGSVLMQINMSNIIKGAGIAIYRNPYRESHEESDVYCLLNLLDKSKYMDNYSTNIRDYKVTIDFGGN